MQPTIIDVGSITSRLQATLEPGVLLAIGALSRNLLL